MKTIAKILFESTIEAAATLTAFVAGTCMWSYLLNRPPRDR